MLIHRTMLLLALTAGLSAPHGTGQEGAAPSTPARAGDASEWIAGVKPTDWETFWFLNRDRFVPRAVDLAAMSMTGDAIDDPARGRKKGIRLLRDVLSDDSSRVRASAAVALGRAGSALDESDRKALGALLHDSNTTVREHAILAVGFTGHSDAVPGLAAIAAGSSRGAALTGDSSVDDRGRALAAIALGLIGGEKAADAVAGLVTGDVDREVRIAGLVALARIASDSTAAREAVMRLAADDGLAIDERAAAVRALGAVPTVEARRGLIELSTSKDARLRRAAVHGLALRREFDEPSAAISAALLARLEDPADAVRTAAIVALGHAGTVDAVDAIRPLLDDERVAVRDHAALGLGFAGRLHGVDTVRVTLASALESAAEPVRTIALRIATAIVDVPTREPVRAAAALPIRYAALALDAPHGRSMRSLEPALATLDAARDRFDRRTVIGALARTSPSTEALAALRESVRKSADADENAVANRAALLARWRDPESTAIVADLVRGDRLPDVLRSLVIEALGLGLDPRPRDPLTDLTAWYDALVRSESVDRAIMLKW